MADIAVIAPPGTFLASLGAMMDAHSRLGEAFAANPALGDYARMQTRLLLAAAEGAKLTLAGGRSMVADARLDQLGDVRLVYLPSFQVADPDRLGEMLENAAPLHQWLRQARRDGRIVGACGASVCHLAAAGLLDGRSAAVHPRLVTRFRQLFSRIAIDPVSAVVAEDGVMSCGPDAAAPRLVFHLIAAAFGLSVARGLANREPDGEAALVPASPDPLVAEAKFWIRERFARDFQIGALADLLGVSHQTLQRRFRAAEGETPLAFVQRMRIDTAAVMLTETRRTVTEIAQLVGYSDIASFRRMFARYMGLGPDRYRRRA